MARRKKKSHHRRGRVRGAGKTDMANTGMTLAGTIIGIVAGRVISTKVTQLQPKIMAAVQAVGGGLIAWKMKSPLVKGIGYGLAANGVLVAGKEFNIPLLSGIGQSIDYSTVSRQVAGYRDVPKIAGEGVNQFPRPNAVGKRNITSIYGGVYGG